MSRWRWLLLGGCLLGLAGCEYEEVEYETGYKGEARRNPWLAAERMMAQYGYDVESLTGWRAPEDDEAVWFIPATVLTNESFVRRVERWVRAGGHLVVLLEKAGIETSDWRTFGPDVEVEPAVVRMLERAGIALEHGKSAASVVTSKQEIPFDGDKFKVSAGAGKTVAINGGKPGVFASVPVGRGRLSAVADARIFRNRWIADQEHAELLLALVAAADGEGAVVFIRGASLSFWGLLQRHLWAVLIGLAAMLVLWLWKNLSRFGPLEAASGPAVTRGYDHHLEALGNFHWQLDRAAALLGPLREQLSERGQRGCGRSGGTADDLNQWLAERSGLPVARVVRALDAAAPADGLALTRLVADLQILLKLPH
jgi:hypothetical protein